MHVAECISGRRRTYWHGLGDRQRTASADAAQLCRPLQRGKPGMRDARRSARSLPSGWQEVPKPQLAFDAAELAFDAGGVQLRTDW